jgi:hypothetical protein
MLVWLVDAVPEVGEELVRLCFGSDFAVEMQDVRVSTQYGVVKGPLDAFLAAPAFELHAGRGESFSRRPRTWLSRRQAASTLSRSLSR